MDLHATVLRDHRTLGEQGPAEVGGLQIQLMVPGACTTCYGSSCTSCCGVIAPTA
jgi:hypothetical protein